MEVQVPKSVDVVSLIESLNQSRTRTNNLISKTYYFLSLLVNTPYTNNVNKEEKGYRKINSVRIKKILGYDDFYVIRNLLKDDNNPVIEINNSYHSTHESSKRSKSYRLSEKYNTGQVIIKNLPEKLSNRIVDINNQYNKNYSLQYAYDFLDQQFVKQSLNINPYVFSYIRSFGLELIQKVHDKNPFQMIMIYSLIGKWLNDIELVYKNKLYHRPSPSNHRFNSGLTSMPHQLRPFIICNGKKLVSLDISSAQPYLLSYIINNEFFSSNDEGLNLKTVYPELYDELNSIGILNKSCEITTSGYTGNSISYTSIPLHNYDNYKEEVEEPFMWCDFYADDEVISIKDFQDLPFDDDFYRADNHINVSELDYPNFTYCQLRNRRMFKSTFLYFIFDNSFNNRHFNPYLQTFYQLYPGIGRWIDDAHKIIGKTKFSYLLQRCESYLVLNIISRKFNNLYPTAPIFTIHDCILTYEEYIPELSEMIKVNSKNITNIDVGIHHNLNMPIKDPDPVDVAEEWNDIKSINNQRKYDVVKGDIIQINIDEGKKFLKQFINL